MVARLTPDQKVACSIHVRFIHSFIFLNLSKRLCDVDEPNTIIVLQEIVFTTNQFFIIKLKFSSHSNDFIECLSFLFYFFIE